LLRQHYFQQLQQVKKILEQSTGEQWLWDAEQTDEDGNSISRIGIVLKDVNIFQESDWPTIISFLKPRIMALDEFWEQVKDGFE
jgi:hypothetical protein